MSSRSWLAALLAAAALCGCKPSDSVAQSLTEARRGFATHLTRQDSEHEPVPPAPPTLFRTVQYSANPALQAYVGVQPPGGGKHPAIIWLVGGFSNSIDDITWTPGPANNDQSATAFREAGIVMMYPSLRGGNLSPSSKEGFYGEVDDVLAAAEYLSKLPYVDPQRIYLGGHSTGGTLALLIAESTSRFRAIFSFGPVEDVTLYGAKYLPFDIHDRRERELRAPGRYLQSITTPTFVFEGDSGRVTNIESLRAMEKKPHSPAVHFQAIRGADHFATLHPMTKVIAGKILKDEGAETNIRFEP